MILISFTVLNKFKRRKFLKTKNLLTGETEADPEMIKVIMFSHFLVLTSSGCIHTERDERLFIRPSNEVALRFCSHFNVGRSHQKPDALTPDDVSIRP